MWQTAAGFLAGAVLGASLPRCLLAVRNFCASRGLSPRVTYLWALLASNSLALGGGALVALISGRLEPYIAAGSVFAGLMIVVAAYRNRTGQEPEGTIHTYALRFCPALVLVAMVGGGLIGS